jgi:hypothetical protein
MQSRVHCKAIRFTFDEMEDLTRRAAAAQLSLTLFIRRELFQPARLSDDASLLFAELGRLRELTLRLSNVEPQEARQIADAVDAIDPRIFLSRVTGVAA